MLNRFQQQLHSADQDLGALPDEPLEKRRWAGLGDGLGLGEGRNRGSGNSLSSPHGSSSPVLLRLLVSVLPAYSSDFQAQLRGAILARPPRSTHPRPLHTLRCTRNSSRKRGAGVPVDRNPCARCSCMPAALPPALPCNEQIACGILATLCGCTGLIMMTFEYESGIEIADRLGLLVPHGIGSVVAAGLLQGKVGGMPRARLVSERGVVGSNGRGQRVKEGHWHSRGRLHCPTLLLCFQPVTADVR
jgi:hypothetical protein